MFRKLCALRVTGTRFYLSGLGVRKCSGNPNFFKKEYLSKLFVTKMKKALVIMSQKLSYRLCICQQENRRLKLILLLTLHATFSKSGPPKNFRARHQRYHLDPLVNAPTST